MGKIITIGREFGSADERLERDFPMNLELPIMITRL